jgi:hypothetical protein
LNGGAITALRQAIAEAEKQEPVAFVSGYYGGQCVILPIYKDKLFSPGTALYTAPVHASDMSQERVDETAKRKHEFECPRCGHCCQQREWVGLTDGEIDSLVKNIRWHELIKATEAKLKEKNT